MLISFPENLGKYFQGVTACGILSTDEQNIKDSVKSLCDQEMVAEVSVGETQMMLRVFLSFEEESKQHIHLDFFKKESVERGFRNSNETIDSIFSKIGFIIGQEINVKAFGQFFVRLDEIPNEGIIRSTFFEAKLDSLSLNLTAAEITIEGAPVHTLSWMSIGPKDKMVVVSLYSNLILKIKEDYIKSFVDLFEQSFRVFVLGKGSE
jgi:hypothetical protein